MRKRKGTVKWYHGGWRKGVITPARGNAILFRQRVVVDDIHLVKGDCVEFEAVDNEATWVRQCEQLAS